MNKFTGCVLALSIVFSATSVQGENWPNWRGPHHTGYVEAENLPATWSEDENILWKTEMPGVGAATPIVWEDTVFVSAIDEDTLELTAIAIDVATGEEKWSTALGFSSAPDRRNSAASPSPVTNGEKVFFLYGTGDIAALDMDGEILWSRNLEREYGRFHIGFGYGNSPLLHGDKLYFLLLHREESFLLAMDVNTGETLWKHVRPSDARDETLEAYTTPILHEHDGKTEIIIFGADYVTGHDPENGEELWRWGNYNPRKIGHWRIVPSPVAGSGHVFVAAPKREPVFAVQLGGEGLLDDSAISWTFDEFPPDVCTPIYHDGILYVLDGDRHVMTAIDVTTGEKKWQGQLESNTVMRASPTKADGKIYAINEAGKVYVMSAGDEFELLGEMEMGGDPARSSIAVSGNRLFIRTTTDLYCIGTE